MKKLIPLLMMRSNGMSGHFMTKHAFIPGLSKSSGVFYTTPHPTEPPIASGVFAPPDGVVGTPYSYDTSQFFTTGGEVTTYSISGVLPSSGLTLNTSTGEIHGTPVNDGNWTNLAVKGTNSLGHDVTNISNLVITNP